MQDAAHREEPSRSPLMGPQHHTEAPASPSSPIDPPAAMPANRPSASDLTSAATVMSHFSDGASQPVQRRADSSAPNTAQVHDAAARGTAGSGGPLPFLDTLEASLGTQHNLRNIQAYSGTAARSAATEMGAEAYAVGDKVAFAGTPSLHTVAHETAHVLQQRAGVQLKGGIGSAEDPYERHADAVADRVVSGQSAADLLNGHGHGTAVSQGDAVQMLGYKLGQPLPDNAASPVYGEDKDQRRYAPAQYEQMWEAEQGRNLTDAQKETIDRGCIGITANNLHGGGNPLDYAEGCYSTFEKAHEMMAKKNAELDKQGGANQRMGRYVLFAKLFWSNQSELWMSRFRPDEKAFLPDEEGNIDMSNYQYRAQSRWK